MRVVLDLYDMEVKMGKVGVLPGYVRSEMGR